VEGKGSKTEGKEAFFKKGETSLIRRASFQERGRKGGGKERVDKRRRTKREERRTLGRTWKAGRKAIDVTMRRGKGKSFTRRKKRKLQFGRGHSTLWEEATGGDLVSQKGGERRKGTRKKERAASM